MTNPTVAAPAWRLDPTDPRLDDARYDEERISQLTPKTYLVAGEQTDLYTIGQLAEMLGRSPITLRKWERVGHLPKTKFRRNFQDTLGGRRLYTKAQVLGVVNAARKCGILRMYDAPRIPREFGEMCRVVFGYETAA